MHFSWCDSNWETIRNLYLNNIAWTIRHCIVRSGIYHIYCLYVGTFLLSLYMQCHLYLKLTIKQTQTLMILHTKYCINVNFAQLILS